MKKQEKEWGNRTGERIDSDHPVEVSIKGEKQGEIGIKIGIEEGIDQ